MTADGVPTSNTWPIFYRFFLDQTSYRVLVAQCRSLVQISSNVNTWKQSKYGTYLRFCTEHSLAEVRRHWVLYVETDNLPNGEKRALKASFTSGVKSIRDRHSTLNTARAAGPPFFAFAEESIKPHQNFWSTGITPSKISESTSSPHTNPTFTYCQGGKKFNIHYGTDPLQCFYLAPALISIKVTMPLHTPTTEDFVESAMGQFRLWCSSFKDRISASSAKPQR